MTLPLFESYREITLTKGQVAIVDADDYEWLQHYSWHAKQNPSTGLFYAARMSAKGKDGRQVTVRMHRMIMGLENGDPREVDHIEPSQTLDNRRSNLRIATTHENSRNRGKFKNNKSGFKGVAWSEGHQKFSATIYLNGKNKHLGRYKTADEAAAVYKKAAMENWGECARF